MSVSLTRCGHPTGGALPSAGRCASSGRFAGVCVRETRGISARRRGHTRQRVFCVAPGTRPACAGCCSRRAATRCGCTCPAACCRPHLPRSCPGWRRSPLHAARRGQGGDAPRHRGACEPPRTRRARRGSAPKNLTPPASCIAASSACSACERGPGMADVTTRGASGSPPGNCSAGEAAAAKTRSLGASAGAAARARRQCNEQRARGAERRACRARRQARQPAHPKRHGAVATGAGADTRVPTRDTSAKRTTNDNARGGSLAAAAAGLTHAAHRSD